MSPRPRERSACCDPFADYDSNDEFDCLCGEDKHETTLPYGQSIVPTILARDPSPAIVQLAIIVMTLASLAALPCLPSLFAKMNEVDPSWGLDTTWDDINGISASKSYLDRFYLLVDKTMGIPPVLCTVLAALSALPFIVLILIDLTIGSEGILRWPDKWETGNSRCYDDMFCEPTLTPQFVRRPGNTHSNYFYLFWSVSIIYSTVCNLVPNPYRVPDAMFGAMLFILAVSSTIWHASNAPKSQYVDIWSMDACIAYLIIRIGCLGCGALAKKYRSVLTDHGFGLDVSRAMPAVCAVIFGSMIASSAMVWMRRSRQKLLDGACPFSGRAAIRRGTAAVGFACFYAGLPAIYMSLPVIVQVFILKSSGSIFAGTTSCLCLVIGWSLRMFERWALDGWWPMNAVVRMKSWNDRWVRGAERNLGLVRLATYKIFGFLLTVVAAVVSPTAILHFFTGITLVMGYIGVRSVD